MSKTDDTYDPGLITAYLSGEASPQEVEELTSRIKADPGYDRLFREMHRTWLLMKQQEIDRIDPAEEWATFNGKMILEGRPVEVPVRRLMPSRALRIAAVMLMLMLPLAAVFYFVVPPRIQHLTATTGILDQTLPDGSQVSLNTGATLDFPKRFRGKIRGVNLTGEAWFDISHQAKPFVVSAGEMQVVVRGTRFLVRTGDDGLPAGVILESGSVAITLPGKAGDTTLLEPGQTATYDAATGSVIVTPTDDPNYLAWKTRQITFHNDPLDRIVETLNRIYHANIRLAHPGMANCRITATFDNQSLESVLKVLEATLGLEIRNTGKAIEISGKGCE